MRSLSDWWQNMGGGISRVQHSVPEKWSSRDAERAVETRSLHFFREEHSRCLATRHSRGEQAPWYTTHARHPPFSFGRRREVLDVCRTFFHSWTCRLVRSIERHVLRVAFSSTNHIFHSNTKSLHGFYRLLLRETRFRLALPDLLEP